MRTNKNVVVEIP